MSRVSRGSVLCIPCLNSRRWRDHNNDVISFILQKMLEQMTKWLIYESEDDFNMHYFFGFRFLSHLKFFSFFSFLWLFLAFSYSVYFIPISNQGKSFRHLILCFPSVFIFFHSIFFFSSLDISILIFIFIFSILFYLLCFCPISFQHFSSFYLAAPFFPLSIDSSFPPKFMSLPFTIISTILINLIILFIVFISFFLSLIWFSTSFIFI